MNRYFFNFRQGEAFSADERGCDFESLEEAYLEAFRAAQDMWSELLVAREDPLACAFEVTDGAGKDLFLLPFLEVLESCHSSKAIHPSKGHSRAFRETLGNRVRVRRAMSEVYNAIQNTRTSLSQTANLLAKASNIDA